MKLWRKVGKMKKSEYEYVKYDLELVKDIWRQIIQLLPSSYNQKRTVMMNYEVLSGIFPMRRNHKLSEWREFCNWITGLPHFVEIIAPVER